MARHCEQAAKQSSSPLDCFATLRNDDESRALAHRRRNRDLRDRSSATRSIIRGSADQGQMVAVPAAQRGDGADGQYLFPSRRRRLVRGFREGTARPPGLLHPRNDPRLAGADQRPLLPAADAPPVLPLRLSSCKPGKPFDRYGLEQQAEIVSHRFLADRGDALGSCRRPELCFPLPESIRCCNNPATGAAGKWSSAHARPSCPDAVQA